MNIPEVAPLTRLVEQPRVDAYAEAARDMNPIHRVTPEASAGPFGRPAAHGMLILGIACDMMTTRFGTAWAESGTLKVRWRSPALPPVTVTARATPRAEVDGVCTYDVTCESGDGEVLLTGTASVRP